MQFLERFIRAINKNKWEELEEFDKKIFNAILLSGGNDLVFEQFQQNIQHFGIESLTVENIIDENMYSSIKNSIRNDHKELFSKLGNVHFALDECHVPLKVLKGVLFHSEYKGHSQNDVCAWSLYEQAIDTNHGGPQPDGYKYSQPSNLFNVFRFVLEEYLVDFNQMTIFASTHYSTWGPIMQKENYTRNKAEISQWTELPLLNRDYILDQFTLLNISESDRKMYHMNELADDLSGRPGLFYEWCYLHLQSSVRSYASIELTIQNQTDGLLRHIQNNSTIMERLYFLSLFKSFNLQVFSSEEIEEVIISGVGFRLSKSTISIESAIANRILNNASGLTPIAVQEIMKKVINEYALLGEIAIMYSVMQWNGAELSALIDKWKPETNTKNAINYFRINAKRAYFVDDILDKTDSVTNIFENEIFWESIIGARTGLRMPDLIFSCNYKTKLCLVAVQVKIQSRTLSREDFENAIASTSVDKMFSGHESTFNKFSTIVKSWKDKKDITFVRIIVCFAGFTKTQIQQVAAFNQQYPSQPILLVSAGYRDVGQNIFGQSIYDRIIDKTTTPQHHHNLDVTKQTAKIEFNKAWILFPDETEEGNINSKEYESSNCSDNSSEYNNEPSSSSASTSNLKRPRVEDKGPKNKRRK